MVLSYANGSIFTRVYDSIAKTCCLLGCLPFERIETFVNIRVYVYEIQCIYDLSNAFLYRLIICGMNGGYNWP